MSRLGRRRRDQRGSATIFMLGFATVLMVGAGIVIDGGLALNKRSQLTDDTEQAARSAANAIDVPTLRDTGLIRVDPDQATAVATDFLSARGYTDISVVVDGNEVSASAQSSVDTAILSLIGINTFTIRGAATAVPQIGIG
ncbi:pilus assembly protein [Kribbella sandramycini]|uniref:Pilus assembly protein n=1 Tax=Kribbella sandramycini TaxID=60450 RepID=A0A7Y4L5B1_9ACTN|nr:pilus assembly protein TadG-related protein [Kribbella sandramycini]MBB6566942.1 Flp pilus assembly protein TadG [Kribbella sandramycini]NOL44664.1 pilus assembly protein [Kribbella sandramycini]